MSAKVGHRTHDGSSALGHSYGVRLGRMKTAMAGTRERMSGQLWRDTACRAVKARWRMLGSVDDGGQRQRRKAPHEPFWCGTERYAAWVWGDPVCTCQLPHALVHSGSGSAESCQALFLGVSWIIRTAFAFRVGPWQRKSLRRSGFRRVSVEDFVETYRLR